MIKRFKKQWRVISERTHRNMGTFKTKKDAEIRLRQVEYFKHKKQSSRGK